ncbi:hypothetical protein [Brevibacillus nitrificans]|nr:hypothetical protein [Brevibacillus nitrificans]MDR7317039.1 hypothetical protein [Brevibacillus nitrificans]
MPKRERKSGEMSAALGGWLCSWLIPHFLLKGRDTSIRKQATRKR